MSSGVKNILIVIGAIIAGSVVVFGIESISHIMFPPPSDLQLDDMDSLKRYMPQAPAGSLALLILAHAAGALISGWIIGRFAHGDKRWVAMLTGVVWTFFGLINLVMIPHPIWFTIADICVYLPMTVLGVKLAAMQKT